MSKDGRFEVPPASNVGESQELPWWHAARRPDVQQKQASGWRQLLRGRRGGRWNPRLDDPALLVYRDPADFWRTTWRSFARGGVAGVVLGLVLLVLAVQSAWPEWSEVVQSSVVVLAPIGLGFGLVIRLTLNHACRSMYRGIGAAPEAFLLHTRILIGAGAFGLGCAAVLTLGRWIGTDELTLLPVS